MFNITTVVFDGLSPPFIYKQFGLEHLKFKLY